MAVIHTWGRKLLRLAAASISVPSTVKCCITEQLQLISRRVSPFYEGECCSLIRRRDGDLGYAPHPTSDSKLSRVGLVPTLSRVPSEDLGITPFVISAKRVAPISRNHRYSKWEVELFTEGALTADRIQTDQQL